MTLSEFNRGLRSLWSEFESSFLAVNANRPDWHRDVAVEQLSELENLIRSSLLLTDKPAGWELGAVNALDHLKFFRENVFESKDAISAEQLFDFAGRAVIGLCSEIPDGAPLRNCDPPITTRALYELCVDRPNRVGVSVAKAKSTVRCWTLRDDWPQPQTWNGVRNWLNQHKDYDIGPPPTD